jgi:anti-sigma factor RsiW
VRDIVKGVAAATVVLLALSYILPAFNTDDVVQKFVQETSTAYVTYTTQHMPPEVESTDDMVVTQWLNNRMGFRLKVPCITDGATQLLGGRLCRLGDRKSAALLYKRNGTDILLFAFAGATLSLPANPTVRMQEQGRPVAMWQRGGVTYSLVGDLPPDELLRLAATVNYREPNALPSGGYSVPAPNAAVRE